MIEDLKPYPSYKDSGVQWLGEVPEHWTLKSLKRWVAINKSVLGEQTDPDFRFYYIDIGTVAVGRLVRKPRPIRFRDAPSRARRILQKGDTIIATVRPYLKATWVVEEDSRDLVASTGFAVLSPGSGVEPKYLGYVSQSNSFIDRLTANSVGIAYPAIAETTLGRFPVAVPPLDEQLAIGRFLDHLDRRIRRYIRAKQKLIGLLNEQKQAIIHHAVTCGLDSNVGLKPSGVEWLGEVPEHWKVRRSKYIFREVDERSRTGEETHFSMSQKHGLVPSTYVEEHRLLSESYVGGKLCQTGDIVLNRLKAHLGVFAVASEPGLVSPDYTVFRAICPICIQYYELILRTPACRVELQQRAKGIVEGFWRLYTEDFYAISLPMPPLVEQMQIVEHLSGELQNIELMIKHAQHDISLLGEYRTRLIADVVTGKLDVREVAARLADETEQFELLGDTVALEEVEVEDGAIPNKESTREA